MIEDDFDSDDILDDDDIFDDDIDSDDDGLSLDSSDMGMVTDTQETKLTKAEIVRLIHTRRFLDHLAEKVVDKEYDVVKIRQELKQCQKNVTRIETERDDIYRLIEESDAKKNVAASGRLRAQHAKLCIELENEEELEEKIRKELETTEYESLKAQVEQGKHIMADAKREEREAELNEQRMDETIQRNRTEDKSVRDTAHRNAKQHKQHAAAMKEQLCRQKQTLLNATRSHERHNKILQKTLSKLQKREKEEEERESAHMEQRVNTLLALKSDISSNRENLRALQARDKALAQKEKEEEDAEYAAIVDRHGNPIREMLTQKKRAEFDKKKEAHILKQRELQVKIAEKILFEEDRIQKRKQLQPYLYTDAKVEKAKFVKPHKKPKLEAFELYMRQTEANLPQVDAKPQEDRVFLDSDDEDDEDKDDLRSFNVAALHSDSDVEPEDDLAEPEFEGLWDKHKPYTVPKEVTAQANLPGSTKMEKEMIQRVMEKHRQGIVIKQVAGGREFKGQAFYSKPDIIHFKDFDVGKQYKRKITLTNVSYTVNYCKLIGITEHLKDFIDVHFDPPGQMSAGLTCEMLVTFKPMINEDLVGQVDFLAQTGPFAIPIICSTKKCDLQVDNMVIDFGITVIGETLKRHITLTNKGAMSSSFQFSKITGQHGKSPITPETSLGRATTTDGISPESTIIVEKTKKEKVKSFDEHKPSDKTDAEAVVAEALLPDPMEAEEYVVGVVSADDAEVESIIPINSVEDLNLDGLTLASVPSGTIAPFSSVKFEITWQPMIPGKVETLFEFSFSDLLSENIHVLVLADAVDVPVWVQSQNVDLKICMYDRLYQETILVNNRATSALRLKFEVCKELRNHIELLPKTGYIQAQAQFTAQLKFLPRKSLVEEGRKYFDAETGVLQAPMVITVAGQTREVPFTVHAIVTTSDLTFDTTSIDYGKCTIYESMKHEVRLKNHSLLPQRFGFLGLPEYVEVQPNDGFGTLLPLEEIDLEIIFKPPQAKEYIFELTCRSLINRDFKIKCKGVGVHPPLSLSYQVIHFAATALSDVSLATLHVINDHMSSNEFTHPVPRIGKGEIAPVGLTSFEFVIPDDAPVMISPSVGTVEPGNKTKIEVRFSPRLHPDALQKEALRMITKNAEARAAEEYEALVKKEKEAAELATKKVAAAKQKGKTSAKRRKSEAVSGITVKGPTPIQVPQEGEIDPASSEYAAAHTSLMRQFQGTFNSFFVPCYVASGKCSKTASIPYSIHNTLYLEIHCPAKKPEVVVISDNGQTTTNFGDVSIGQSVIKSITIQNISSQHIKIAASTLDTLGPFQMLNALRALPPDTAHTILICFTPERGEVFQETLDLVMPTSTLHLTLKGKGVNPIISLSIQGGVFNMGAILANEYREEIFTISNTSALSVQYAIILDSQSLLRHTEAQSLPDFVEKTDSQEDKKEFLVGTQNYNGQNVFDCVPAEGLIHPGSAKEILITFAPDHPSDHYSDFAHIQLFGQEEMESFQLQGEAKSSIMYLTGGDALAPSTESLAVLPHPDADETDTTRPEVPLLVTLSSIAKGDELTKVTRDIFVGCVRTMAVSQKKNGEWTFDNIQPLVNLGFNVDPIKGMLEAGSKKPITITWTPPDGFDPSKPISTSINCQVKGDVTETYKVMIRAFVVSE